MRRFLIALAFVAPALFLLFFSIWDELDPSFVNPLFHFYIVTFTTFAAAVVSIFMSTVLGEVARPRHQLAAAAFAVMGIVFIAHGAPTRGALIAHSHPAVPWSAWLTLFSGAVMFVLSSLDGLGSRSFRLPVRSIIYGVTVFLVLYFAILLFTPGWLTAITDRGGERPAQIIFWVTLSLWLLASGRFLLIWRASGNRVDGMLALVAAWLAASTVSLHQFPLWNLSWWFYHVFLLAGFLLTTSILVAEYEQARRFRLLHYFLGISLIFTALLALLASHLFGLHAAQSLASEIETVAAGQIQNLTSDIAGSLPADADAATTRNVYTSRLVALPLGDITVYDTGGIISYPASSVELRLVDPDDKPAFDRSLAGETVAMFLEPGELPPGYTPTENVHLLEIMAPLPMAADGEPAGVVRSIQEVPQLTAAVLRARQVGLLIALVTMGILFVVLLLVVYRADRIITARTEELAAANFNLRRSEAIREDLTDMIVHDLRSPLTAIAASLDLLNRGGDPAKSNGGSRFIASARAASRRMEALISDILAVSKIEAGELQPEYQRVALYDLLAERLNEFEAQATAENKELHLDGPQELVTTLDPVLIGRVVDNLVSNAFKYTTNGSCIQISEYAEDGRVWVTVRDDGPGVPDDYKEHIFGKFAQVPQTRDERAIRKGTGLGLAFCRLVVEAHGGQIWVDDAPAGGSDFKFWLPIRHA
jgi:signal transduction histidine kinase